METGFYIICVILFALIFFFIILPIILHIIIYAGFWFGGRKLFKILRNQGRIISLRQARKLIKENKGMIIVDTPTLGWNVKRVWWSPTTDFVNDCCSDKKYEFCNENDIMNYNKYIDDTTGTAKLISRVVISQMLPFYLKMHFGASKVNCIFTAGVKADLYLKNNESESNNSYNSDI